MASIRLPGLLTGLDTNTLIAQLMAIKSRQLNKLEEDKSRYVEKTSALNLLESKLTELRTSVRALSDAEKLRAFSASSSDTDILTAHASNNAFEGNHTIEINQLATAERWIHTTGLEYVEDYVGEGTFIYSYNNKETSLTTTATTTLEDFVGLINNDANNPGVTASILHYNDAYHLVLNGNDAGSDYKISVNECSTEVWHADITFTNNTENATLSTKIVDLDQFTENAGLQGDEQIQITGTDHYGDTIDPVNIPVTSNTKLSHLIAEIEDAYDGNVKVTLENGEIIVTDKTADRSEHEPESSLSILLTYDQGSGDTELILPDEAGDWNVTEGGDTVADLTNFTASDFIIIQMAQDSKIKVDGYPSVTAVSEVQTISVTAGNPNNGHYHLTYNGQTTGEIDYNAGKAVIQAAIDALKNVNSGDITVDETGTKGIDDGDVTFTFSDTLGDVPTILVDDSALTGPGADPEVTNTETIKGVLDYISRSSNTIDDVITGVTLNLHDTTEASGEEITLTRNIKLVKARISDFMTDYNAVVTYLKEKTGYNDELKTAGVLMGDYIISTIRDNIRTPIISQTSGFIEDIDSFLLPTHLGLEIDRDGLVSLDGNVFDEAVAEDYLCVLDIIGADKTGSSDSNVIEFYSASSDFTTADTYDVRVVVNASQQITSAEIKLSSESEYRTATYSGNIVTGDSTFDDDNEPVYPENGLQVSVDVTQGAGTYTATVRVKQGFTGVIEDALDNILKTATGAIPLSKEHTEDTIEEIEDRIELEERRLDRSEERLINQFTRLERALTLLQNQMTAFGLMMTMGEG